MACRSCWSTASKQENPFPSVAVDNFQAGYLGGRHLFDAGYRHVAFFGHGHRFWILNQRHEGFLEAAREAGTLQLCQSYELSLDPEEIQAASLEDPGAARTGRRRSLRPATSPPRASSRRSRRWGCRVPDDIALLVMDDFEALTLLSPAISVVAQPSTAIAETGWRMLQALIAGDAAARAACAAAAAADRARLDRAPLGGARAASAMSVAASLSARARARWPGSIRPAVGVGSCARWCSPCCGSTRRPSSSSTISSTSWCRPRRWPCSPSACRR